VKTPSSHVRAAIEAAGISMSPCSVSVLPLFIFIVFVASSVSLFPPSHFSSWRKTRHSGSFLSLLRLFS
jgi:hypothetical protein